MSMESTLVPVLTGIVPRIFPDTAPAGTARPYGVYQQVGGPVVNHLDNSAPAKYGARVQVIVWAATRLEASSLMQQIEQAIRSSLSGRPAGALVAQYDEDTELRGAMQDFTFWHS